MASAGADNVLVSSAGCTVCEPLLAPPSVFVLESGGCCSTSLLLSGAALVVGVAVGTEPGACSTGPKSKLDASCVRLLLLLLLFKSRVVSSPPLEVARCKLRLLSVVMSSWPVECCCDSSSLLPAMLIAFEAALGFACTSFVAKSANEADDDKLLLFFSITFCTRRDEMYTLGLGGDAVVVVIGCADDDDDDEDDDDDDDEDETRISGGVDVLSRKRTVATILLTVVAAGAAGLFVSCALDAPSSGLSVNKELVVVSGPVESVRLELLMLLLLLLVLLAGASFVSA